MVNTYFLVRVFVTDVVKVIVLVCVIVVIDVVVVVAVVVFCYYCDFFLDHNICSHSVLNEFSICVRRIKF